MKIPQNEGQKGSLKWLQTFINQYPAVLNQTIAAALEIPPSEIQWVSPLQADQYAEYRDEAFLEVLGLEKHADKLRRFWPKQGPQWDALGRVSAENGPYFLVEAKANIPEIISSMKATSDKSIALIRKSLGETANYLACRYSDLWENGFYQHVNRTAHLYFLRQVCGVDAFLVFVYFVGDPSHIPTSLEQWSGALELQKSLLGLKKHRLDKSMAELFIDTKGSLGNRGGTTAQPITL